MQSRPLVVLLILFMSVPFASGALSPAENTLWADVDSDFNFSMAPSKGSPAYGSPGFLCIVEDLPGACVDGMDPIEFMLPMKPALSDSLILTDSGTVEMHAFISMSFCEVIAIGICAAPGAGVVKVSSQLLYGGEVIADGAEQEVTYPPVPSEAPSSPEDDPTPPVEVVWSVQPSVTALDPSKNLEWRVLVSGGTGAGNGVFLGMYDETWSHLVLPIGSVDIGEPEVVYSDLTGAAVHVTESYQQSAKSGTVVYNWTTDLTSVEVAYGASDVGSGSATLTILDGAGDEILTAGLSADDEDEGTYSDLTPGDWTIRIEYTEFLGDMSLDIKEYVEEKSETSSSTTTTGTAPASSTQTATQTQATQTTTQTQQESKKKSPGFDLIPVIGLVGAALLVVRRRL